MKKVGKYLLITILILLGLFFASLLFLFFVPKSSIFGITFISYNECQYTKFYDDDDIDNVVLESRSYEVNVKTHSSSQLYAKVENHSLGYVLKDNQYLIVKESVNNNTLTLTVVEPHGAAFKNNSEITIFVPKDKEISLSISNKNALVNINDENLKINNLSYSTKNGSFNLNKAKITGNFNLDLNKAIFTISKDVNLNSNNVNLKITTGKFNAQYSGFGNFNITTNERGVILFKSCANLTQSMQTSGGRIEAESVSNINYSGSDTNMYITEITSGAIIKLTNGEVYIGSISGTSDIITSSGNVTVGTATSNLTVLTTSGNIEISNAHNKVRTTSTSGNINVYFSADASFADSSNLERRYLIATSASGNVTASGVNRADVNVTSSGAVSIGYAEFQADLGLVSSISTKKGSIYVTVDSNSKFVLNSTTSGSSRINFMQTEQYKGWTDNNIKDKEINGSKNANSNLITISSQFGSILMHDNKVN